jgi:hypothetical protein
MSGIGAQLTLSESRLSDGFAPRGVIPVNAVKTGGFDPKAAVRRARDIGRP